jgi:putative transposase
VKFDFIRAEKAHFSVSALCRVLGVTRQGFYAFLNRPRPARAEADDALYSRLRSLHAEHRQRYGRPRLQAALQEEGVRVGKRRLERALRMLGLYARRPRRFIVTTLSDASHPKAENVLDRNFTATRPNERWVTDITYLWTSEGWSYLAVILDLFSRRIVGWAFDDTMTTSLPLKALEMAIGRRGPDAKLLHHSDRGCQYTSADYRAALDAIGAEVSMSRKGNCWDNAVAESFFATLKTELVHRSKWATKLELRAAVFEYIELYYNRRRLHSTLGYKTPAQVESDYELNASAA